MSTHLGLCPSFSVIPSSCLPSCRRNDSNSSNVWCHIRCTRAQFASTTSGLNWWPAGGGANRNKKKRVNDSFGLHATNPFPDTQEQPGCTTPCEATSTLGKQKNGNMRPKYGSRTKTSTATFSRKNNSSEPGTIPCVNHGIKLTDETRFRTWPGLFCQLAWTPQ